MQLNQQTRTIPGGRAGLDEKVRTIRRLVEEAKRDPYVREAAVDLVRHVPQRDTAGEIAAVWSWVRDNVRYTRDPWSPDGFELFVEPATLLQLVEKGRASGDCDDHVLLASTLLEVLGYPTRYRIGATPPGEYRHIWLEVLDPKAGWRALELTKKDAGTTIDFDPSNRFAETLTLGGLGDLMAPPRFGRQRGLSTSARLRPGGSRFLAPPPTLRLPGSPRRPMFIGSGLASLGSRRAARAASIVDRAGDASAVSSTYAPLRESTMQRARYVQPMRPPTTRGASQSYRRKSGGLRGLGDDGVEEPIQQLLPAPGTGGGRRVTIQMPASVDTAPASAWNIEAATPANSRMAAYFGATPSTFLTALEAHGRDPAIVFGPGMADLSGGEEFDHYAVDAQGLGFLKKVGKALKKAGKKIEKQVKRSGKDVEGFVREHRQIVLPVAAGLIGGPAAAALAQQAVAARMARKEAKAMAAAAASQGFQPDGTPQYVDSYGNPIPPEQYHLYDIPGLGDVPPPPAAGAPNLHPRMFKRDAGPFIAASQAAEDRAMFTPATARQLGPQLPVQASVGSFIPAPRAFATPFNPFASPNAKAAAGYGGAVYAGWGENYPEAHAPAAGRNPFTNDEPPMQLANTYGGGGNIQGLGEDPDWLKALTQIGTATAQTFLAREHAKTLTKYQGLVSTPAPPQQAPAPAAPTPPPSAPAPIIIEAARQEAVKQSNLPTIALVGGAALLLVLMMGRGR